MPGKFLERDVPLSQSLIWRANSRHYAERGLKSWTEDFIPQFITNNPFIAESYARLVNSFLLDCSQCAATPPGKISPSNPLRILELGAGLGKFSYLLLKHLAALLHARGIPLTAVSYCMTDCSETLIDSWRANSFLAEFVQQGVLQFASLDANERIQTRFLAGEGSGPEQNGRGPLVVIANYFFDSLPQDVFRIKQGHISERLQTTGYPETDHASDTHPSLANLQFEYIDRPLIADHYLDASWNRILETYRTEIADATILFPTQVFRELQSIREFTPSGLLVLASDKGFTRTENLPQLPDEPRFEFHSANCFSTMVNFDAIAKFFRFSGGTALLPSRNSSRLHTCAFLQGPSAAQFPAVVSTYAEINNGFLVDDLFGLLDWLNAHLEELTVAQALSLLRLTRWDTTTFIRLFPVLVRQIRNVTAEREDLRGAIAATWENQFSLTATDDVLAFYCGVLLLELRFLKEALAMFRKSKIALGPSAATSYNLGLCAIGLSQPAEALLLMLEACQLDPTFEPAQLARRKLLEGPGIPPRQ